MTEENNRYRFEEEEENKTSNENSDSTKQTHEENVETEQNDSNLSNEKSEKKSKVKKLSDKIEELEEKINKLEEEKKDLNTARLMAIADAENYKKRIEADKETILKYANQKILEKLVNEIDLFDKVVNMPTDDPNLKNFLIGFDMINKNLKNILSEEGVKKIEVKVGDQFDPRYHHVLQTTWDDKFEENAILGELRGGYTYKDRVLCTTLVKVNKKESE